jgi:DNA-binding CsgD family transcriptional regulator
VHTHPLVGRTREQRRIAELIDAARQRRSGALVLRGEAGIGKTALLEDAVAQCPDIRIIQIRGAEAEMELPYAAIQQFCTPLVDFFAGLPEPQRRALSVALGVRSGGPPDRLLVGLAVLTLFGEASRDRPTLCVIDDAQWVDVASLQALAIVARRVHADSVAMIFAVRDQGAERELSGIPELVLNGLTDDAAAAILAVTMPGRIDNRMRQTIIFEAGGNPLALQELHGTLTPEALAGGYGMVGSTSRADRIERAYAIRIRELPTQTRTLLLIAAAEQAGRPEWLWTAAEHLGIGADVADAAEGAYLITRRDDRLYFRHPLVRSAAYRGASTMERQRVHAALAAAVNGSAAEDYRAWHQAHAAPTPDERVASELERSAQRAFGRGGIAASAAFLDLAARLTPNRAQRAERAIAASYAKLDAGAPSGASRLLRVAEDSADSELCNARVELLRAKIGFATSRRGDAAPLLLAAAKRLEGLDPPVARETYLEAITASILAGRLAQGQHHSTLAVANAAREAPPPSEPLRSVDLLLDGLVVRLTDGLGAAAPVLKNAIRQYMHEEASGTADPRWHDITHRVCIDVLDWDTYSFLVVRQVEQLRNAGALTVLGLALQTYAGLRVTAGDFAHAAALLDESDLIIAATGSALPGCIRAYLAAYRGQEQLCRELVRTTIDRASSRGEGFDVTGAQYAAAILHTGLGQYREALAAATWGADADDVGMYGYMLTELVEAAARCGEMTIAAEAVERLVERTDASGTKADTALGLAARSTALVQDGAAAEAAYLDAIAHLKRSQAVVELSRAHLVYGEWLRRMKRRADARTQLRLAHDMFEQMGAQGFLQRARRELRATGEVVVTRPSRTPVDLTSQELQIATLAQKGYTNPEIAGQLFLSPRTVEWHLSRVFSKLGVTSRRELRTAVFDVDNE